MDSNNYEGELNGKNLVLIDNGNQTNKEGIRDENKTKPMWQKRQLS
jgi:hypothetical protein